MRHLTEMAGQDVNQLFAHAEAAFAAGRLDEARRLLDAVQRAARDHDAVLHLRALVEKRSGDAAASEHAFRKALALAPASPQINNNYGNLLDDMGKPEAALDSYDRALKSDPRFADARLNRALLLRKLGRAGEALAELDSLLVLQPRNARAHSARGSVLRALARLEEAEQAYERALALDRSRLTTLHGRARVALEQGKPASEYYRQALRQAPGEPELVMGLAEALQAEGDPGGMRVLHAALEQRPDWTDGHELLALMRSEAGEGAAAFDHYDDALRREPGDAMLAVSLLKSLAKAERHAEALGRLDRHRALLGEGEATTLMEAVFASESGDLDRADAAFARVAPGPEADLARARHDLRAGRPESARVLLEAVVTAAPGNVIAWAHLGLAWRLLSDSRHAWLAEQPGLVRAVDLGIEPAELAGIAEHLRTLHRTRAHPIGQSLRGGTQTKGTLFARPEPTIAGLRDAIWRGVQTYVDGLPEHDPAHPLLRHRHGPLRFSGSWSVRLSSSGFHVNHIHPRGVLSSACYISLPATLGGDSGRDGWLELGAPPVELGLDLEALAQIEPGPGRLALFPSYLFHGTRPFADGERLSVAFDVAA